MDKQTLANYLDFANHHQGAQPEQIKELCRQVKEHGFYSAFVNPCYVGLARKLMGEGKVGTVIAFPLGQETKTIKVAAAVEAIKNGADELDVSMNVGLFKAGKFMEVREEMKQVVQEVKSLKESALVKFIIETGLLSSEEIKKASELVWQAGADFIKTCSGFGPRGAKLSDVDLIKSVVGKQLKIKVAGGVDTKQEAMSFIERGVSRIGTSHAQEIII